MFHYRTFVKNLRVAQEAAMKKKKNVDVNWRGYKDTVEPTEHRFTLSELRGRLIVALREILKINKISKFSAKEESVSFFLYFI